MLNDHPARNPIDRLEALGRAGFVVSICCGPCGPAPFEWTVHVMNERGQEFDRPFLASSFAHAVAIAELEITKRGWMAIAELEITKRGGG